MKFMILGRERVEERGALEPAESERRVRRHQQALQELAVGHGMEKGEDLVVASAGLTDPAEAVTVRAGPGRPSVAEGPADDGELFAAGFDVVELESREAAIAFARRCFDHPGHASEIRPVRELWSARHGAGKSDARTFALLLHADEAAVAALPEEAAEERLWSHYRAGLDYAAQKGLERGEALAWTGVRLEPGASATTLRLRGAEAVVSDGPFAEAREVVGGVVLVDCASREEAVHWATRLADPDGGAVEVRPVRSAWWIYHG